MPVYEQRIVRFEIAEAEAALRHMAGKGAEAVRSAGGQLFGVFKPVIGLSQARAVVITQWSDNVAADRHGPTVLAGLERAETVERDLWTPSSLPKPGDRPSETSGYYSHRAFDIRADDWPRFLELSETAWGNFEATHATRVVGFWRCRQSPAPGLLRVRLMAWYENLDAWDRSRWWNPKAKAGSGDAFARFKERNGLLRDTSVSILQRVDA